jgi:hypothetical protein
VFISDWKWLDTARGRNLGDMAGKDTARTLGYLATKGKLAEFARH